MLCAGGDGEEPSNDRNLEAFTAHKRPSPHVTDDDCLRFKAFGKDGYNEHVGY